MNNFNVDSQVFSYVASSSQMKSLCSSWPYSLIHLIDLCSLINEQGHSRTLNMNEPIRVTKTICLYFDV